MVGGELSRPPLRETGKEMRSRLAPKLEVGAASKVTQLEMGERPLQSSDDKEDPGEYETRQWSDGVGEPQREWE